MSWMSDLNRSLMLSAKQRGRRDSRPACESLEGRALLSTTALINELNSYPYPYNYPNQFVEIETVNSNGTIAPNTPLTGDQFVRFDGYNGGNPVGKALLVVNLGSYSTGANGLLIIEADNTSSTYPAFNPGPPVADPQTTVVHLVNFDLGNSLVSLGNGTNTYAIVNSTGGTPLIENQAYDPDNTGVLTLPAGDSFTDGFSFTYHSAPGNSSDQAYLPYLQVPSGISPNAISRVAGNTTVTLTPNEPLGAGSQWYGGYLQPYSNNYDPNNSVNLPSNGGALTPGWANVPVVELSTPVYSVARPSIGSKTLALTLNVTNGTLPANSTVVVNTFGITAVSGTNFTAISNASVPLTGNTVTFNVTIKSASVGGSGSFRTFGVVVSQPQVGGIYSNQLLIAPAGGTLAPGTLYSTEQPSIATIYIANSGTAPNVVTDPVSKKVGAEERRAARLEQQKERHAARVAAEQSAHNLRVARSAARQTADSRRRPLV